MASAKTIDRFGGLVAAIAIGFSLCAAAWGQVQPPAADSVKVHDRPSDDGSAVVVEWPKPAELPENVQYVIEIARKPEDFADKKFQTIKITPSKNLLKTGREKYFGFAASNQDWYAEEVTPAEYLKPQIPWAFTAEESAHLRTVGDVAAVAGIKDALTGLEQWKSLTWCVKEGLLSEKDAQRAWLAWKLTERYAKDVTAATAEATAVQKKAEEELEQAVEARKQAQTAVSQASGPGLEQAKESLAAAVAAEARARAALRSANEAARMTGERVREGLTKSERSDVDWLGRLDSYLEQAKAKRLKKAMQEINAGTYCYRFGVRSEGGETTLVGPVGAEAVYSGRAEANLFRRYKLNNLVFALAFSGIVLTFIQIAKRNPNLYIRKIAGLEAVEEAIGRATEMGRSAYFVHGLGGVSDLATIAAINVLSRVARRAAEYDTRVRVMNWEPIVTAVSQEVVQQAYTEAGRPDAYDPDDIALVGYNQFSYAAAVAARMVREQPAAIFLIGYFLAESLLLSETGASTGAIQVAGTDSDSQLPFFITTCDYTLIGEELYAASAYLSREPRMLGSLRGQDVAKAFLMTAMVVGTIVFTMAVAFGWHVEWIKGLFEVLD